MFAKVHKSRRHVVAICDSNLVGKKFEEGVKQLDVRENFYKGEELNAEQLVTLIKREAREDATFNIVGKESVKLAIETGIINEDAVGKVNEIPFVLKLL